MTGGHEHLRAAAGNEPREASRCVRTPVIVAVGSMKAPTSWCSRELGAGHAVDHRVRGRRGQERASWLRRHPVELLVTEYPHHLSLGVRRRPRPAMLGPAMLGLGEDENPAERRLRRLRAIPLTAVLGARMPGRGVGWRSAPPGGEGLLFHHMEAACGAKNGIRHPGALHCSEDGHQNNLRRVPPRLL